MRNGSDTQEPTPRSLGFHMPAEWEPQEGIWLAWPEDIDTFPDLPPVEEAYVRIIRAISPHEKVHLLVHDTERAAHVRAVLDSGLVRRDHLVLHEMEYTDVWIRDYGPTFIVNPTNKEAAMVDWRFNAWGNKYPELLPDDDIPSLINSTLRIRQFSPGIVLEGGSIDVNGSGTVMTTEQCLLNHNRNPGLGKGDIEWYLGEYLGCSHVLWLKEGIAGDDTDGHIDDIARFAGPSTILCSLSTDPGDENYEPLRENYRLLSGAADQAGRPIHLIPLPVPHVGKDGARLPASYANFLVTNRVVLLPVFGQGGDRVAKGILERVFPGRDVLGIDCRAMVRGLGALHCVSQQQPIPGGREEGLPVAQEG